MKRNPGKSFVLSFVLVCATSVVCAQPSHVEQLQHAAVSCLSSTLGPALEGIEQFTLDADDRAPYLRGSLIEDWTNRGYTVFESDSLRPSLQIPDLRYHVDRTEIMLEHVEGRNVRRTAHVALRYLLLGPDGQILSDRMCQDEIVDLIERGSVMALADSRYAETNVQLEYESVFKKILEPAVIVGAVVVGTYLFFNLRSKRSDN